MFVLEIASLMPLAGLMQAPVYNPVMSNVLDAVQAPGGAALLEQNEQHRWGMASAQARGSWGQRLRCLVAPWSFCLS